MQIQRFKKFSKNKGEIDCTNEIYDWHLRKIQNFKAESTLQSTSLKDQSIALTQENCGSSGSMIIEVFICDN